MEEKILAEAQAEIDEEHEAGTRDRHRGAPAETENEPVDETATDAASGRPRARRRTSRPPTAPCCAPTT